MINLSLYQGDCLTVFPKIKDESVDLIVTSPPYNVGKDYGTYKDNLPFKDYYNWSKQWLQECYRVNKIGGRICLNIPLVANTAIKKGEQLETFIDKFCFILKEVGYTIRETLIWLKASDDNGDNFCGNNTAWGSWLSPSSPYCRSFTEFILVAHKLEPKLQHEGKSDLTKEEFLRWTRNFWVMRAETDVSHVAPFPEELPYRCIKLYSYIGDTILDPFLGSGTTMKVARDIQRNCIGIELNPKYIQLAKNRVNFGASLDGEITFQCNLSDLKTMENKNNV
jgi:site-specific DNA-methyltransferase (adenine-specific)